MGIGTDVGAREAEVALERAVGLVVHAAARCGATVVVAVDGPSGSGKTILARRLRHRLGRPPIIHMDALYPGWDGLDQAAPLLHDWVLAPLARGERAAYRRFDWVSGRYAEWHHVPATPLLLVEGAASGARPAAAYLSVLVWVEAERDVRFARGIARDGEAYRPQWERWAGQEQAHFAADGTRERADVILDTTP